ncbi:MAG: hypothetical protein NT121_17010 [Chloroflexi bacterium]|nr:hypothetical protein [Chloroflexota bacterium]
MEEKSKVVVTSRSRRPDAAAKQFAFSESQIPAGAALHEYRQHAWQAYQRAGMPVTTDEAWRRTDLRTFPAEAFRIPMEKAFDDLPRVPAHLLKPLVADLHGGQIILTPGGAQVDLDEKLVKQGVVFTDLNGENDRENCQP